MVFEVSPKDLQEFEAAERRLKETIAQYQQGVLDLRRLVTKLRPIHRALSTVLERIGETGHTYAVRLENALEKISSGDQKFIFQSPHSYHYVAWEAHHLLVNALKQRGIKYYATLFVGWNNKKDIPAELKPVARLFRKGFYPSNGGEIVVMRRANGWIMYINAGGNPGHFTIVERIGNNLRISISDFILPRLNAVKEVLAEEGFRQTRFAIIQKTVVLKDGEVDTYSNFLLDMEGSLALLDTFAKVLFMSLHLALAQTGDERRDKLIVKHILRNYLKNPKPATKIPLFGEEILFSDLREILGRCSDEEAMRILDELLAMSRGEVWRVVHERYHFNWRKFDKATWSVRRSQTSR